MKKIIAILVVALMLVGVFAGCEGKKDVETTDAATEIVEDVVVDDVAAPAADDVVVDDAAGEK
jgi:hypothetical protein